MSDTLYRGLSGLRSMGSSLSQGHFVSDGSGRDSYIHQDPGLVRGPLPDFKRPLNSKDPRRTSPCKSFKTVKSLHGVRSSPFLPKEGRIERWLEMHEMPGSVTCGPTKRAAPHPDELLHSGIRRRAKGAPVWPSLPVPRHRHFSEGGLAIRLSQRETDMQLGRSMAGSPASALRNRERMGKPGEDVGMTM
jgi:hypothetical protein